MRRVKIADAEMPLDLLLGDPSVYADTRAREHATVAEVDHLLSRDSQPPGCFSGRKHVDHTIIMRAKPKKRERKL